MAITNIKGYIESLNGKFFTVKFIKKDGSTRTMNARTGVVKYLKGGKSLNSNPYHIVVFDMATKGYRTVDLSTVFEIHSQNTVHTF